MNLFRTLGYYLNEGLLALWRHKAMHGFALFVVALSLFVLGFSRYLTGNVNALLSTWESSLEVRLFLDDGVSKERVDALEKEYEADPLVASVSYISPEQALQILSRFSPAFSDLGLKSGENPLPASLSLRLKAPADLKRIKTLVGNAAKEPGVSQALFDWDWVDKLRAYSRFVGILGWILFGALGAASVFTVSAITRILALSRREEIAILHFVGATNASIRGPFVAGGAMLGFFSGLAALLLLAACHLMLHQTAGGDALLVSWISRSFLSAWDQAGLVLLGAILGAAGGAFSIGSPEHWH